MDHMWAYGICLCFCLTANKAHETSLTPGPGSWNSTNPLTALDFEGVVLVQAPSSQLGSIDFIALQHCCSLLPQDQIWAGFILITHGNCREKKAQNVHVSKAASSACKAPACLWFEKKDQIPKWQPDLCATLAQGGWGWTSFFGERWDLTVKRKC